MSEALQKQTEYPTAEKLRAVKEVQKSSKTDASALAKANATPMMRQYFEIKEAYPDYLLFYRMGDFYELFFNDAVIAAEILDIALTRRGKHDGDDIPMCGVPHHSHESYLHKLITYGQKVAICEQTEDPAEAKKRGAKSVVRREVVRVITPGTLTEDSLLDAKRSNYLLAIVPNKKQVALAWADMSTGVFYTSDCAAEDAQAEVARINPQEILAPDDLSFKDGFTWLESQYRSQLTGFVTDFFDGGRGENTLKDFFSVKALDSFGLTDKAQIGAAGAVISYFELTQLETLPRIEPPKPYAQAAHMVIDASTRKNLELSRTLAGDYKGSLLHTINRTITGPGARLLSHWLHSPLCEVEAINDRLDAVDYLLEDAKTREFTRKSLKDTPDMERALTRIYMHRGSPRDLLMIREGLKQAILVQETLAKCALPKQLAAKKEAIGNPTKLHELLTSALKDTAPLQARDGGFIQGGYNSQLDSYRDATENSNERKEALKDRYAEETGVKSLKIKQNNVIGTFIEVTPQYQDKMLDRFVHRQTLAGALRYTTPELRELEEELIAAQSNMLELELSLFKELCDAVLTDQQTVIGAARALAELDGLCSLATLAEEAGYNRPTLDDSTRFDVAEGRHPVVEALSNDPFIANGCTLEGDARIWLMTGPNMAGKSTFLRQNALMAILAQMGSFVPAASAHIGVVDRVFSRVGAADDLARGQSTFMVEMVETATILNQATEKSLVILDEIGRGTATFDGLAIAWAVVEQLHDKTTARALFATHYHELTLLEQRLKMLACYTMKVREWEKDVVFLHQVEPGSAKRSYGIHVAKLAGLPKKVIARAEQIMEMLSKSESHQAVAALADDLPLFASDEPHEPEEHPVLTKLAEIDVDNLSPRDALDILYALKEDVT